MNLAVDSDSQQWPMPHTQHSRPTEQTHSLDRDTAIKQADTCADTLGTFAFETHEQQLELKQTSSSSSEISRRPRGHMLHMTVQCLPTRYSDKI